MKKLRNLLSIYYFTNFFLLPAVYSIVPSTLSAQSGWGPDVRLTYRQGYSYDPKAACCGDIIHLVWWESYSNEEVFYKRSIDAGVSWEADIRLTPEDYISCISPKIAVCGSNVHIIWYEFGAYHYALCYIKSTDGGNTWSAVDTLRKEINGGWGDSWLCAQDSNIYVVYIREDSKMAFMKSANNGSSWSNQYIIGDGSGNPRLEILKPNSNCLASCVRFPVSSLEILFYRSTNAGTTWVDTQIVSDNDSIESQLPMIDTDDSGGVHITWFDYKYSPYAWTGDIFYRASMDSGSTWKPVDTLTIEHRAVASDILAEGSNLHLVWEDDRDGFGNNFEIYYRMSTNLGRTWGSEDRLTDAINWSRRPSLASDGGYLHLFWFDMRDDSSNIMGEIYYKRKSLVGIHETIAEEYRASELSLDCPTILKKNSLIRYDLGSNNEGAIFLIDVAGRIVATFSVRKSSCRFIFPFNQEVYDGVYFLMLKTAGEYLVKKILVMH